MSSKEYICRRPTGFYCTLPIIIEIIEQGMEGIVLKEGYHNGEWPFLFPPLHDILVKKVGQNDQNDTKPSSSSIEDLWSQIFSIADSIREICKDNDEVGPDSSDLAKRRYAITDEGLVLFLMIYGYEAGQFICPLAQTPLAQRYETTPVEYDFSVLYSQRLRCAHTQAPCIRHKWPPADDKRKLLLPHNPEPSGDQAFKYTSLFYLVLTQLANIRNRQSVQISR